MPLDPIAPSAFGGGSNRIENWTQIYYLRSAVTERHKATLVIPFQAIRAISEKCPNSPFLSGDQYCFSGEASTFLAVLESINHERSHQSSSVND